MRRVLTAVAIVILGLSQMATAVTSSEIMLDPRQDQRARALYGEVRCVVCQNEAIGDSQADIAADMRREIRTEILSGKTDTDIREGLTARYGDYVLFRPRFSAGNLILWLLPLALVLAGVSTLAVMAKTKRKTKSYGLDEGEQKALDDLINKP
ncbi:cytochrome c-type biogenesis protein [Asticcacaulis machinosus]|uniref:Cytochrome c-type biogenesis protein n=1 Tax=Asticcacaulis machinosus TaxID=2984211 RepID=A0ABT5HM08_9CAUL|nr:cytochrome c-type biogenesis protein [Asticcacaulis machinosus]MDC7677267.1 cytochrome c-type biogenesis protein CcmH [Asticcacaulis machinosus]